MLQGVEENAGREPDTAVAGAVSVPRPVTNDPFLGAAERLADLCLRLDEGEPMTAAFLGVFGEAKLALAEEIDERKAMMAYLTSMMTLARQKRAELDSYVQRAKAVRAKLKEDARDAIQAQPDLPWRDSLGHKVYLSSSKSLKLTFEVRESKTITNVIDVDLIDLIGIDRKFIEPVGFLRLDTEAVRSALKAGEKLHWATIETKKHVCGLEKKDSINDD